MKSRFLLLNVCLGWVQSFVCNEERRIIVDHMRARFENDDDAFCLRDTYLYVRMDAQHVSSYLWHMFGIGYWRRA